MSKMPINPSCLHSIHKHPRQPKRHLLWELIPLHGYLKTITKIDMNHLSCCSLQHQITWVSITKSEDIPHYGHCC
jgi:hypothetical protein